VRILKAPRKNIKISLRVRLFVKGIKNKHKIFPADDIFKIYFLPK